MSDRFSHTITHCKGFCHDFADCAFYMAYCEAKDKGYDDIKVVGNLCEVRNENMKTIVKIEKK